MNVSSQRKSGQRDTDKVVNVTATITTIKMRAQSICDSSFLKDSPGSLSPLPLTKLFSFRLCEPWTIEIYYTFYISSPVNLTFDRQSGCKIEFCKTEHPRTLARELRNRKQNFKTLRANSSFWKWRSCSCMYI